MPAPRVRAAVAQSFGSGSYLGVDVADVTSDRAKELKLNEERGAEITAVDSDAPAGKAGLKEHDVVLSLNGQRVESAEQMRRMIHELPAGRNLNMGISRDGHAMTLTATLADRQSLSMRVVTPHIYVPAMPPMNIEVPQIQVITRSSGLNGMMVQALGTQLGEYFGAPNGRGLLVTSVEKNSSAESAGLKAGDVIVKVDNERVTDISDWRMAVRNKSGQSLTLGIIREKREQTVTLKVPERGSNDSSFYFAGPDMETLMSQIQPKIDTEVYTLQSRAYGEAVREMERSMRDAERQVQQSLRDQQRTIEREKVRTEREIQYQKREAEREKARTLRDAIREQ